MTAAEAAFFFRVGQSVMIASQASLTALPRERVEWLTIGVPVFVEHGNLIVMKNQTLATFVIKEHHIVRSFLFVVHDHVGASFAKSLDDLGSLGSSASARSSAEA